MVAFSLQENLAGVYVLQNNPPPPPTGGGMIFINVGEKIKKDIN